MITLTKWEQVLSALIQLLLYLMIPWNTETRLDTAVLIIVLGIAAVYILGGIEWLIEHGLKIEIPG